MFACLIQMYTFLSPLTITIYLVTMSKNYGLFLQVFCIRFQLLKNWLFFKQIEVTYRNSISNYELMRRAAKKTVVIIFGVTHAKLYEYTSRTEAFTCIGNESLD